MKKTRLLAPLLAVIFTCTLAVLYPLQQTSAYEQGLTSSSSSRAIAAKTQIQSTLFNMPISFIKNVGQKDQRVQFYEHGHSHTTYFTRDGIFITLLPETDEERYGFIRLFPRGAGNNFIIEAENKQWSTVNYFKGNDPGKWKRHIPAYGSVVYRGIYPGIDMKFYGSNRHLEYDIVVTPGADPSQVRLSYEGIDGLIITPDGNLEILLHSGKLIQRKPRVFQEVNGKRIDVEGTFVIHPEETVQSGTKRLTYGFEIASYDKGHPLIIDPVLDYSTYIGGSFDDYSYDIALDGSNNIYITGYTSSVDFPMASPLYNANSGNRDVFVTKINAAGDSLIYSTYLGGSANDEGHAIAVDSSDNAYITGSTASFGAAPNGFPTQNPYQATNAGGTDVFVTKINAAGNDLVYSTYLGGSNTDVGHAIAVDGFGNVYVTGSTASFGAAPNGFPTQNPYQATNAGGTDVFVTKINAEGIDLPYSTYLGGSNDEEGYGICVDGSGNAYVTGYTESFAPNAFPINNAYQGVNAGGADVFITKINPAGDDLPYSTYLGGGNTDQGHDIAVDGSGNAYVIGHTASFAPNAFPTKNAYQTINGGGADVFITKINSAGNDLPYSTYLGGNNDEEGFGIAVDGSDNAYITGYTASSNFPTASPLYPNKNTGTDVFVTKINSGGTALVYSTFLGGGNSDVGQGIVVDSSDNVYITGYTDSIAPNAFPTKTAYQGNNAGGIDGFITKITEVIPPNGDSGDTEGGCFISTTSE